MSFSIDRALPRILLTASAVLFSACSVTPPGEPELPFALPETFQADLSASFAPKERWWHDFGDPELNDLVETALVRNPAIAQAVARARMAEARIRQNRADLLPQVHSGFAATPLSREGALREASVAR